MKGQVEWKNADTWVQSKVEMKYSQLGNVFFKHDGKVYVLPALKEGAEVVSKEEGKWAKVGRFVRGVVFLGEGLSFSETTERNFLNSRFEAPVTV